MSMKLSRFTGGKQSPTIRRFERAFIQPFSEIFTKVQFGPGPAVKRSSYYTDKKQAFCGGVFRNVYKEFKKHTPSPEKVSLLYAEKSLFFRVISRRFFIFSP